MYFVEVVDALGEFSRLCAGVGYVGLFKLDLVLPNAASCSYLGGRRTSNSQRITLKKAFRNLTSRCMHAPHALPARAARIGCPHALEKRCFPARSLRGTR